MKMMRKMTWDDGVQSSLSGEKRLEKMENDGAKCQGPSQGPTAFTPQQPPHPTSRLQIRNLPNNDRVSTQISPRGMCVLAPPRCSADWCSAIRR